MEALKAGDESVEYRVVDLVVVADCGSTPKPNPLQYFETKKQAEDWKRRQPADWAYVVSERPVKALRVMDGSGTVRFFRIGDDVTHLCFDAEEEKRQVRARALEKLTPEERLALNL